MRISDWSSDVCSSDLSVVSFVRRDENTFVRALDELCEGESLAFGDFDEIGAFSRNRVVIIFAVDHDARGHFHLHFRSEEHTSELQSLMRISYAVFCLKKKKHIQKN